MTCNKVVEFRVRYRELLDNAPDIGKHISWQMSLNYLFQEYNIHKRKCDVCKYFRKEGGK